MKARVAELGAAEISLSQRSIHVLSLKDVGRLNLFRAIRRGG